MKLDLNNHIHRKAIECIRGYWGNGIERKKRLGIDYIEVQKVVNEICRLSKGRD